MEIGGLLGTMGWLDQTWRGFLQRGQGCDVRKNNCQRLFSSVDYVALPLRWLWGLGLALKYEPAERLAYVAQPLRWLWGLGLTLKYEPAERLA